MPCPGSWFPAATAHQYFQEWLEAGVSDLLWQEAARRLRRFGWIGSALAVRGGASDQGTSGRPKNREKSYGPCQTRNETLLDDGRQWNPAGVGL
jgi:transposase